MAICAYADSRLVYTVYINSIAMEHPEIEPPGEDLPAQPRWVCFCNHRKWLPIYTPISKRMTESIRCQSCGAVYWRPDLVSWLANARLVQEKKRQRREPGIKRTGEAIPIGKW